MEVNVWNNKVVSLFRLQSNIYDLLPWSHHFVSLFVMISLSVLFRQYHFASHMPKLAGQDNISRVWRTKFLAITTDGGYKNPLSPPFFDFESSLLPSYYLSVVYPHLSTFFSALASCFFTGRSFYIRFLFRVS